MAKLYCQHVYEGIGLVRIYVCRKSIIAHLELSLSQKKDFIDKLEYHFGKKLHRISNLEEGFSCIEIKNSSPAEVNDFFNANINLLH